MTSAGTHPVPTPRRRVLAAVTTAVVVSAGLVWSAPAHAGSQANQAAASGPGPVTQPTAGTATAQSLPTAQVDGVVWSQAVAGDTVYVGGSFANARPAGAAAGVATVPRTNLMAYTLSTGVMTSFAPVLDAQGQVYAVAVTPDRSRVYVAGQFTTVGGVTRNRIAAFDTSTGTLVASFAPAVNYVVKALAVTNTTVYAGGSFSTVGKVARNRVAAFDATSGALLPWNPNANGTVQALTTSPDGTAVYLGGAFSQVGSTATRGLAEVDATTGAAQPWAAAAAVRDSGTAASILTLTHDATNVYGSGYVYGSTSDGNLEGVFAASLATGALTWVEDCHGDTYGVWSSGAAVYSVGHAHDCARVGGFPETSPRTHHNALSWTPQATGTLLPWTGGQPYASWGGTASPSMQNWFPDLATGTYTGKTQAAWTVTGTGDYVLLGGEFPTVDNTGQQGLARFAVPSVAVSHRGPQLAGAAWAATSTSPGAGTVAVTVPNNWDQDDLALTYTLYRNGDRAHPVTSVTANGTFWQENPVTLTDRAAPAGSVSYQVRATDPSGNTADSATTSVTVAVGNRAPTAAFTSAANGLTLAVDGSGSSDPDGTVAGWAWTFGDGGTAVGAKAGHTYGTAGTYPVGLTVTDNSGATTTLTRSVSVGSPTVVARDTFARTTAAGWGTADVGGAWTIGGPAASRWSVASGTGRVGIAPGYTASAELPGTAASVSDSTVDVALDQAATGGGTMVFLGARHQGSSYYGLRAKVLSTGQVQVSVSKVVNGTDTQLALTTVPGVTYSAGLVLHLRLQVSGSTTVTVRARVWSAAQTEPTTWQVSGTDATTLLPAGDVWLSTYVSASATAATTTWSVSNLAVVPSAS